jgi:alkylation response protein AidB-like acyl-CoA dehydrogenase
MNENSFEPSHEQILLRDSVRNLCRSFDAGHRDRATMRRNWATFAGLGWLMAGVPEELGGLGAGLQDQAIIAGELAAGLAPEPYLACGVLAPHVLAPLARASAAAVELLEAAMAGERVIAVAGDLSPRRLALPARREADRIVVSGTLPVVPGGGFADTCIVPAQLDNEPLLLVMPSEHAGLTVRDFRLLDGSPAAEIELNGAVLDPVHLLAHGPAAKQALDDAIERTTVIAAADLTGAAEAALWQTRDYLKVRRQFGVELASFQSLQHRMADMYIGLQLMHSGLHYGMAAQASANADERRCAASACKIQASRRAREITGQAIQLHGGIGVTEELAVGQYFRRASVVSSQFGGTDSHIHRLGDFLQPDPILNV